MKKMICYPVGANFLADWHCIFHMCNKPCSEKYILRQIAPIPNENGFRQKFWRTVTGLYKTLWLELTRNAKSTSVVLLIPDFARKASVFSNGGYYKATRIELV